ncbi:MAG TPA: nucleoside triphosphate pyrophosphohydrolase [Saprospiraceae bacterium]|nr:nucleoside triphosphate pyrophosphohydrolase [Saprospiraceae bacterium]
MKDPKVVETEYRKTDHAARTAQAFIRLVSIMDTLRAHCPWDKKQNFETLRNLTLEEAFELADAIAEHDLTGIKEEVGDLLLHMVFYAKLGSEVGAFDLVDCLETISEKLIRRHPHIYGDTVVADAEEVKRNWEAIKKGEGKESVLDGVPTALPAMVKAVRLQEKTRQVGFEWENVNQVWDKVEEELREFKAVRELSGPSERTVEEFGDVLFSLINYARFCGIDPELALERVNKKFIKRFRYIEQHAPRPLMDMTLSEMDALWEAAKTSEPQSM